jgi:hypothetical protein
LNDTPQTAVAPCRLGGYCSTRNRSTGQPGPDEGRGLCWPDERHGQFAIGELVGDWLALMQRVGKDAGRQGFGSIPTACAEAPIPIHEHIEALTRQIAWTLDVWAQPVRERARLAEDVYGYEHQWQQRRREGAAVQRDSGTLTAHYSVLLALAPVDYLDYETVTLVADDGPGAVAQMVQLHHRARSVLGVTKRRERRDLPCPPKPYGCGLPELGEWLGSGNRYYDTEVGGWVTGPNIVDCGNCGWSCDADDYAMYAITFIPPKIRAMP